VGYDSTVPADVPHISDDRLGLDELLDDGAHDDEAVVHADHHVPDQVNNLKKRTNDYTPTKKGTQLNLT
jgi:hypothetical protein